MVEHLVGLQAQDNQPPYFGLAARLEAFDPYDVTRGLEDRSLVRLLTMRSTVHLLVADDALVLRQFTRPIHERERKVSQNIKPALDVDLDEFAVALRAALADGPLPVKQLGEALTGAVPRRPRQRARPPGPGRGAARPAAAARLLEAAGRRRLPVRRHLARPPARRARPRRHRAALPRGVRSRLRRRRHRLVRGARACPPCSPRWTTWSTHTDAAGKKLVDLPIRHPRRPRCSRRPVRLLGLYDNVWLSHAGRDRVTDPAKRKRWMGVNGGLCNTVFVDGWLEGLWRVEDGRPASSSSSAR